LLVVPSGATMTAAPTMRALALESVPWLTEMFQALPTSDVMVSPEVRSLTKFKPNVSLSTASAGEKSRPV
jgi:hypothetical protein